MPIRNRHKALTADKITRALRRALPDYIKLLDGKLNMDENIYQTAFAALHRRGCKYISASMDGVRPELLDDWAELAAHQMHITLNSDRNIRGIGDARVLDTDYGSWRSVLPNAPANLPEYGRGSYFGRMLERLVYRRTSESADGQLT